MFDLMVASVFDLSSDGWGVVRSPEGKIVFVPGAWPGDVVNFEIVSEGKFNLGKLHSYVSQSDAHRKSRCIHSDPVTQHCGTCPWIGIHYKNQLKAKTNRLEKLFKKAESIPEIMHEIIPSPEEFHYRNRIKLFSNGDRVGYREPLSQTITDVKSCPVVEPWINEGIGRLSTNPPPAGEFWIQKENPGTFQQGNTKQNINLRTALSNILEKLDDFKSGLELFCGSGNFSEILAMKIKKMRWNNRLCNQTGPSAGKSTA